MARNDPVCSDLHSSEGFSKRLSPKVKYFWFRLNRKTAVAKLSENKGKTYTVLFTQERSTLFKHMLYTIIKNVFWPLATSGVTI